MKNTPEGLMFAGAVALIVFLLSQSGGAHFAPGDLGADVNTAGKENRRDPRRLLIPIHERPERPMLADTSSDSDMLSQRFELRLS